MTTETTNPGGSNRGILLVVGGCLIVALCLGGAIATGAGYWFVTARSQARAGQPAVEYILDASPRMTLQADDADATRLVVARGVLAEIVRPADPAVAAGLRVFGSGLLPDACRDTDLLVPLALASQTAISDRLARVEAGAAADAALAEAMVAAIRDLSAVPGPHTLVVVTGGEDSCNSEAGQLIAREADQAGIDLRMFVVGYQVTSDQADALKGFADDSGGDFFEARDADELRAVLDAIQDYVDSGSTTLLEQVLALATPGALATEAAQALATPSPAEATPAGQATDAGPGTPTATPALDSVAYESQTACDHPYFPLRQGATWEYSSEFGNYTWTVTEVTGDLANAEATMLLTMEEGVITYHWLCGSDGVVSYDFGSFTVSTEGGSADMEVLSSEGAWLPSAGVLESGGSWTHAYTMRISSGADGMAITTESSQSFTAGGLVSVAVPAGAFDAYLVNGTGTTSSTIPGLPSQTMDSTFTYWLAYGVGMVRSDSTAAGEASTSELVSYFIP